MREYFELFVSFFKIGILTFGGGYAMLPMLEREIIEKKKWCEQQELLDYFAVGQCTPGVIAVNTATFIGYKRKRALGGIIATIGVISPSLIIITVIAALLKNFAHIKAVQDALTGIRIAVCALITASVIKIAKSSVKNIIGAVIAVVAFVVVAVLGQNPIFVVIGAALLGLFVLPLCEKGKKKKTAVIADNEDSTASPTAENSSSGDATANNSTATNPSGDHTVADTPSAGLNMTEENSDSPSAGLNKTEENSDSPSAGLNMTEEGDNNA